MATDRTFGNRLGDSVDSLNSRIRANPTQSTAMGMTGLMLVVTSIVLGVTLSRHKVPGNVTAMTVLTALVLLAPYYRLATLELVSTKTSRMFYMASVGFVAWLIIFAIVAGRATPIQESFENVPTFMPHHHHHHHNGQAIGAAPYEEPVEIPRVKDLEAFDDDE